MNHQKPKTNTMSGCNLVTVNSIKTFHTQRLEQILRHVTVQETTSIRTTAEGWQESAVSVT